MSLTFSSDDDIDVILRGTPEQKRRLRRRSLGLGSSSEDDFEKEMAQELDCTMKNLADQQKTGSLPDAASTSNKQDSDEKQLYDSSYFDSDSDEEETSQEKSHKQHPVISNDDLLYDPGIDDDNQRWVDKQRRQYQPHRRRTQENSNASKVKPLPHSDAVLNCPACMTLLCLDCQRHTTHSNQYRAMFVMNCNVESGETLRFPEESSKKSKSKQKKKNKNKKTTVGHVSESIEPTQGTSTDQTEDSGLHCEPMDVSGDVFNPVKCTICKTEVGVYDSDEVYHFFNVLASY